MAKKASLKTKKTKTVKTVKIKTKISGETKKKKVNKKTTGKIASNKTESKKVGNIKSNKTKTKIKKEKESYLARWTTPAFVSVGEEIWLYRLSLIASVIMSVWSFYQKDFLTGITFGLLALVVAKYLFQKPQDIECQIDLDGIKINPVDKLKKTKKSGNNIKNIIKKILSHEVREKFYSFDDIESFEVAEKGTYPEDSWHNHVLKIKGKEMFFPHLEISLDDQDPVYIRELMVYFVPEKRGEEESVFGGGVKEEEYVEVDYEN